MPDHDLGALFQTLSSIHRAIGENRPTSLEELELWDWYGGVCPCGLEPGDCTIHKRARTNQRPPEGDWTKWLCMAGRGFGKTRVGAEWVKSLVHTGRFPRIALVAATAADVRDVMVQGESGILEMSPPWCKPFYQPSLRKLTWPNGTTAFTYSADEPDRFRGPQHHAAWCDEPAAWRRAERTVDMLMLGLRLGSRPMVLFTTTPRPTKLIKELYESPKVVVTRGTTYDNRPHLAPAFYDEIITKYEGTRLGEQELNAEILELTEGAWFPTFSKTKHVSPEAEYKRGLPARVAIDAGISRYTGAVMFQIVPHYDGLPAVHVFADYLGLDKVSADNAKEIRDICIDRTGVPPEVVRLDPYGANARTSIGPTAYSEYEAVFGGRITGRWPGHSVVDGLDQIEIMLGTQGKEPRILIHPRCEGLIEAFKNYRRKEDNGEFLDEPVDPQHSAEDYMDALRGGIRDAFPEGRKQQADLRESKVGDLY